MKSQIFALLVFLSGPVFAGSEVVTCVFDDRSGAYIAGTCLPADFSFEASVKPGEPGYREEARQACEKEAREMSQPGAVPRDYCYYQWDPTGFLVVSVDGEAVP